MAQTYEPTSIGLRLAGLRREAGLSAAALADLIPSERITRAVISNIESGRRPEPTWVELSLLASGLGVSPLRLALDTADPWGSIGTEGLAEPYDDMTVIEYAVATDILDRGFSAFEPLMVQFLRRLLDAEEALFILNTSNDIRNGLVDAEDARRLLPPTGRTRTHFDSDDEATWDHFQFVLDVYRDALSYLELMSSSARVPVALPARYRDRLERLAQFSAAAIVQLPDLDYGQNDRLEKRRQTPALDPSTGRPL